MLLIALRERAYAAAMLELPDLRLTSRGCDPGDGCLALQSY
jgi:hypothetical protein